MGQKIHGALLTASTQYMRKWAMDVYMENEKKTNSTDDAEVHHYKHPEEGLEHLHERSHGWRCRLGFFSRSSLELHLKVVGEDDETVCSASEWSNDRDGLAAGWPKTSRRAKHEPRHYRARKKARLGNGNTAGGFLFLYLNRNAMASQLTEVGTSGAVWRWPHGA
jgi:hypothetical protein